MTTEQPAIAKFVLYHANCPDGFGSAYAAWLFLGSEATYIPVKHGESLPSVVIGQENEVYICDFAYPRNVLLELKDKVKLLQVLDHHKTAETDLQGLDFCEFDMNRSGAGMTWDYFFKKFPDRMTDRRLFFSYIEDRDLWRFKLPNSKEITTWLMSFEYDFQIYENAWLMFAKYFGNCVDQGATLMRQDRKNIAMICDQSKVIKMWWPPATLGKDLTSPPQEYKVAVCNATSHWSDVGNELLIRHPEADFSLQYYRDLKQGWKYSLRSNDKVDVSALAKFYGGGGHKNAAGFQYDLLISASF